MLFLTRNIGLSDSVAHLLINSQVRVEQVGEDRWRGGEADFFSLRLPYSDFMTHAPYRGQTWGLLSQGASDHRTLKQLWYLWYYQTPQVFET